MSTRSSRRGSTGFEVGGTYRVPRGALVIGANVRSDTHPGAKEFAASIKARGVLEPITAWVDDDGDLVVYRGQRRTLAAASVGTPDGLVPVHVVTCPAEVDRVTDQLVENVHRAAMRAAEERDAIEQLSLLGVSAAQITKRTAITRPTVDAALTVSASQTARERMDATGMTLEAAATFAEFEDDLQAIQALEQALSWGRPLEHTAQRLRDARAEEGHEHHVAPHPGHPEGPVGEGEHAPGDRVLEAPHLHLGAAHREAPLGHHAPVDRAAAVERHRELGLLARADERPLALRAHVGGVVRAHHHHARRHLLDAEAPVGARHEARRHAVGLNPRGRASP